MKDKTDACTCSLHHTCDVCCKHELAEEARKKIISIVNSFCSLDTVMEDSHDRMCERIDEVLYQLMDE
jgi:uncharacterized tellurite resistance protein B-like protein